MLLTAGRWPCRRSTLALTYWCGSTSIIVAPSSGRMYDFDFDLLISSCLAPSRGSRGRQCDGDGSQHSTIIRISHRIARSLSVSAPTSSATYLIGAASVFELPAPGGHAGAFCLEGRQRRLPASRFRSSTRPARAWRWASMADRAAFVFPRPQIPVREPRPCVFPAGGLFWVRRGSQRYTASPGKPRREPQPRGQTNPAPNAMM